MTDIEQIAAAVIETEDKAAVMDSMILCKFIRGVFHDFYEESAEMLHAVTGLHFSGETLKSSAQAIVNLRKAFNQREGWGPEEDCLPEMFFQEENQSADLGQENRLTKMKLRAMIRSYNLQRGWSVEGFTSSDTR